ncbi:NifB/NifX family molybdenum-iron cluster-binding protein [Kiritimatiella glycovorans]|nr:NifB/NifX family molybdenum-iron cluster-binding protein [Kiritimatiella glycovorans]
MNIVITALGERPESPLDPRFGRARFLLLYDTETDTWSAHDNSRNLEAGRGAGIQTAQRVIDLNAEAVITGHCGPNAYAVLEAGKVAVVRDAGGSAREVVEAWRAGTLAASNRPDVSRGYGRDGTRSRPDPGGTG